MALEFLIHMAVATPIFGFACALEERETRNRVTIKRGVNTIESWVGRDTQKYIPGLYWLTLLSSELAERHHIPLSAIESVALEHLELRAGQHLFRFYERPEDWRSSLGVVELCSSRPGFFHIEEVRRQLVAARTFLDVNAVTRDWK